MRSKQQGSALSTRIGVIVGIALAIGGFYVSVNVHIGFVQKLNEQGIPLDLGKTVSSIGMFLVLFPVLKYFYFNPLGEAITNRTSELEKTFGEAEELRGEMTKMRSDYEQRIIQTEASAREQIQSQIKEAQDLRQQLMAEASAKADEMVRRASEEIERDKNRVLGEIRMEVVNLTLAATERVLGENVDSDRNRRLIQDFIDKVEVPS